MCVRCAYMLVYKALFLFFRAALYATIIFRDSTDPRYALPTDDAALFFAENFCVDSEKTRKSVGL